MNPLLSRHFLSSSASFLNFFCERRGMDLARELHFFDRFTLFGYEIAAFLNCLSGVQPQHEARKEIPFVCIALRQI
jgi:hypothetical protein